VGLCSLAAGTSSRDKLARWCPLNDAWGEARLLTWKLHHSTRRGRSSLRTGPKRTVEWVGCCACCQRGCSRVSWVVFVAAAARKRHHCKGMWAGDAAGWQPRALLKGWNGKGQALALQPGCIFTTLHFIRNLRTGPIS